MSLTPNAWNTDTWVSWSSQPPPQSVSIWQVGNKVQQSAISQIGPLTRKYTQTSTKEAVRAQSHGSDANDWVLISTKKTPLQDHRKQTNVMWPVKINPSDPSASNRQAYDLWQPCVTSCCPSGQCTAVGSTDWPAWGMVGSTKRMTLAWMCTFS